MTNHKVSDIAKALSLSTRRVQQLVKENILPAPINGNYDLADCLQAYGQYLLERSLTKNTNYSDLNTEKLRLLKAQADKVEFEVQIVAGKYIEVSEIELSWSNLLIAFRSKMLSMPTTIARQLQAVNNDFAAIVNILQQEIEQALLELSNYKGEADDYTESANKTSNNWTSYNPKNSEDCSPAAQVNGKPVGR